MDGGVADTACTSAAAGAVQHNARTVPERRLSRLSSENL